MESNKKFNNSDKPEKDKDKDTKPTISSSTSTSESSSKSEPKQQPLEETAALESSEKQTKTKSPDTSWFSEDSSSSDSESDSESKPNYEELHESEIPGNPSIRRYLDTIEEETEPESEAESFTSASDSDVDYGDVEDSDLYGASDHGDEVEDSDLYGASSDSGSDKGKAMDTEEEFSPEAYSESRSDDEEFSGSDSDFDSDSDSDKGKARDTEEEISSSDKGKEKDVEENCSGYTGGSECRRDSDNESLSTIAGIEHDISDCKEEMSAIRKLLSRNYATKIKSSDAYEKTKDMNEEQQLDYINKHGNTLKKEYPDKYDDNKSISDNAQSIRDTATERERELCKIMNEKVDEHNDMYIMRGDLLFGEGILRRAPRVSTSNEEDSNESAGAPGSSSASASGLASGSGSGSNPESRSESDSDSGPESGSGSSSGPDENSGGSILVGEDTDNPDDIDSSSPEEKPSTGEEEPSTENGRNNISFKEHFIFYTSYTVSILGDIIDSMFNHFFF